MNPWLGLASYSEESLNHYNFYGRDKAIEALVDKIKDNLFVTLYGRSGIGKTSLLQAGVIPKLRKEGFYPLVIRFDITDNRENFSSILWETVIKELYKAEIIYKSYKYEYTPDFNDILVLRKLFASGVFLKDEQEVIPVMIFDQFEEILYKQPKKSRLFLQQLYALIDDNLDVNIAHREWQDNTDFRIVVSIREDDLYLLEDMIDTLNLEDFKENRYRLLPLSLEEAKEIIIKPAPELFKADEINEIADKIIELSSTDTGKHINTLILSLLCYTFYEKEYGHGGKVSLDDLTNSQEDLIEIYYLEAIKDLPIEERKYIEDHLVDNQGRRNSISSSELQENAPNAEKHLLNSSDRLLNFNHGRIELIHDKLAETIHRIKKIKYQKEEKNKRYKRVVFGFQSILVLIIVAVLVWFVNDTLKEEYKQTANFVEIKENKGNINEKDFYINSVKDITSVPQDSLSRFTSLNTSNEVTETSEVEKFDVYGNVAYILEDVVARDEEGNDSLYLEVETLKYAGNAKELIFAFPLAMRVDSLYFGKNVENVKILYPTDYNKVITENPHTKISVPYFLYENCKANTAYNSVHLERMGFLETFFTRLCYFIHYSKKENGFFLVLSLVLLISGIYMIREIYRRESHQRFSLNNFFYGLIISASLLLILIVSGWNKAFADMQSFIWSILFLIIVTIYMKGLQIIRNKVKIDNKSRISFFFMNQKAKKEAFIIKRDLVSFGFKENDIYINPSLVRMGRFNKEEMDNTLRGCSQKIILVLTQENLNEDVFLLNILKKIKKSRRHIHPIILNSDKNNIIIPQSLKWLFRNKGLRNMNIFPILEWESERPLEVNVAKLAKSLKMLFSPKALKLLLLIMFIYLIFVLMLIFI